MRQNTEIHGVATYRLEKCLVIAGVVLCHSLLDHDNSDLSWGKSA